MSWEGQGRRPGLSDVTVFLTLHVCTKHETRPVRPAVVKRILSAGFVPAAAASRRRWRH